MKDVKYLLAYLGPVVAYFNIVHAGVWSFSLLILYFVVLPLVDMVTTGTTKNLKEEEEKKQSAKVLFNILLHLNFPILITFIVIYFNQMEYGALEVYEKLGLTIGTGLLIGVIGINVAHELGHRSNWFDLFVAKSLLMTAFYMHFNIEHNRGHHKFVATAEDPSSARFKESIFLFWFRSISGVYVKAWELENLRLKKLKISVFSIHNEMIRFHVFQLIYVLFIAWFWSWTMVGFALIIALIGVLLLESVNYIEHYGLRRKKKPSGRYEAVGPHHSWNSNNEMGRIFLYELTRHSDHHFKANRKYQILRHFDESPQLPTGYPGCILLSLVPPLWFRIMNKKVVALNKMEISY